MRILIPLIAIFLITCTNPKINIPKNTQTSIAVEKTNSKKVEDVIETKKEVRISEETPQKPLQEMEPVFLQNNIQKNPQIEPKLDSDIAIKRKKIKILHFSSWEGSLLPLTIGNKSLGGAAFISTAVKKLKEQNDVILCNTGNFFRGDINDKRPVVEVLNLMGLDVCNISNLELNYGPDTLKEKLEDAKFKVLSANIYEKDKLLFPTSTTISQNGTKIGFIGITSREAAVQSVPQAIENLIFREPLNELKKTLEKLRPQVDILILLSNLRHKEDVRIAKIYPQIDLIIGRYEVAVASRQEQVGNTLIVRTNKKQGVQLGEVTVSSQESIRAYDPILHEIGQDSTAFNTPNLNVQKIIDDWQELEKKRQETLCKTTVSLEGEYSQVRQRETNLGNLFADIILETRKDAQVSLINSGAIRASISAGSVTYGNVLDSLPYKNKIVGLEISGNILKEVLENSVAHYNSIPGAFLQVGGISFDFSKNATAFSRVSNIKIQGENLALDKKYKVLTLDYIADGGDDYIMLKDQAKFYKSEQDLASVISEYLRKQDTIYPRVEQRIQILP